MNQDIFALASAFGFSVTFLAGMVMGKSKHAAKVKPLLAVSASIWCYLVLSGLEWSNALYGAMAGLSAIGVWSGGKNVLEKGN